MTAIPEDPSTAAPTGLAPRFRELVAPGEQVLGRRTFLGRLGLTSSLTLTGLASSFAARAATAQPNSAADESEAVGRRNEAYRVRTEAARIARKRPLAEHPTNGDERRYATKLGSFTKGLPHDAFGEVDREAYAALLAALASGESEDFERVPLAGPRKLVNPQAAYAYDLEGSDSHSLGIPPAPALASAEAAAELAELYWMAAARDVPFTDYAAHPTIAQAAAELSGLAGYRGPRPVTPDTIFRGHTPGDLVGPYVSQFLWLDIPMGAMQVPQVMHTALPGLDYLTTYADWLAIQNGEQPAASVIYDPSSRYIRSLRDLAEWVHVDALYQAYHQACLILLGLGAPVDPGNPYVSSATQAGFVTMGGAHILSLVTEVATRALKAVWFQKWLVHRRLRPEAMGGLVHQVMTGMRTRPLHADILGSGGLQAAFAAHGTYLLPQAYPEGSPLHPSYGAGHATVAGACVTVLKAWFDEAFVIPGPVVADAAGLSLHAYSGRPLTVGNELNKLAANVSFGRNAAGIHYRSDYSASLRLGEMIALSILEEQAPTFNERASFSVTLFDGTTMTI